MSIKELAAEYAKDIHRAGDADVIVNTAKVLHWCLENGYFSTELTSVLLNGG